VMTHRHVCFVAVTAIIVSGQLILGGSAVITALTGHHLPLLLGCASCMCLCTCVCAVRTVHARHCFSSHDKPDVLLAILWIAAVTTKSVVVTTAGSVCRHEHLCSHLPHPFHCGLVHINRGPEGMHTCL